MMGLIHDFSDYPQALLQCALDHLTWGNVLVYDTNTKRLAEAPDAKDRRRLLMESGDKYAFWNLWMRFSFGVENLVKAVFLQHQIFLMKKRDLMEKCPRGSKALKSRQAAEVYKAVGIWTLVANRNVWLQQMFLNAGIKHPHEIDSGTLGSYRKNLHLLRDKQKMTDAEVEQVSDALEVLSDIRRNVDAHVSLKIQLGGSIQHDLEGVYIPAANVLIDVFYR